MSPLWVALMYVKRKRGSVVVSNWHALPCIHIIILSSNLIKILGPLANFSYASQRLQGCKQRSLQLEKGPHNASIQNSSSLIHPFPIEHMHFYADQVIISLEMSSSNTCCDFTNSIVHFGIHIMQLVQTKWTNKGARQTLVLLPRNCHMGYMSTKSQGQCICKRPSLNIHSKQFSSC